MTNIVLFSKDRACQCESFLRSMKKYFKEFATHNIKVLYTYSNDNFKSGYDKLISENGKNVKFIKETNFKKDLLQNINTSDAFTVFFVDDIIWINEFTKTSQEYINFTKSTDTLCFSLRLNPNLTYSLPPNLQMTRPRTYENNKWNYTFEKGCFGYPFSVDGHIFFTKDIIKPIMEIDYRNPNDFEGKMSTLRWSKQYMMSFDESKIFNNPCNIVQSNNPNTHGEIDAGYLNDKFLNGYRIDIDKYKNLNNTACHMILPIDFIR